ncbi:MAG: Rrf2 family transcriptional regulator [Candidatus Bipolaricaulia bacterium]
MKLSKHSHYGLTGLSYLAQHLSPDETAQVNEVAEAMDLPQAYLAKIFHQLSRHRIVRSYRGRSRGFQLARPADEISVREVVEALEGPDLFERCIFWDGPCSHTDSCPLHASWAEVRPQVRERLEHMSVADLSV